MKTKLTLLLLCFCSSVFSETYVLIPHNSEVGISKKLTREESFFIGEMSLPEFKGTSLKYEILKESEQILFLVDSKGGYMFPSLEYILIDKIENTFRYGSIDIYTKKEHWEEVEISGRSGGILSYQGYIIVTE